MTSWLSPRCPLTTWEKTWTETRMRWLADRLGIDRLLNAPLVLPSAEFFPDPYEEDFEGAVRLLDRLGAYMGLDPFYIDETIARVEPLLLADTQRLLARFARELAFTLLPDGELPGRDADDAGPLCELLTVFLGVGVFGANSTVYDAYGDTGLLSWWVIGCQGYPAFAGLRLRPRTVYLRPRRRRGAAARRPAPRRRSATARRSALPA